MSRRAIRQRFQPGCVARLACEQFGDCIAPTLRAATAVDGPTCADRASRSPHLVAQTIEREQIAVAGDDQIRMAIDTVNRGAVVVPRSYSSPSIARRACRRPVWLATDFVQHQARRLDHLVPPKTYRHA
jgi:hypothetical protein